MMSVSNLAVLAYAQGFTLWLYRTDAVDEPRQAGFFDPIRDQFAIGDMILATGAGGGSVLVVGQTEPAVSVSPLA